MDVSGQFHAPVQVRAHGTHWIEGCVGPKPVWMQWQGENIPVPARNRTTIIQPVA
jgi:hypothetical protein